MAVLNCRNGDIELAYETFGASGEPLLLIAPMGVESRLTYHEDFCAALVERGFQVTRFDNRDGGLSSRVEDGSKYTLRDMADDAVAVLDALGWPSAHIFGASMGGMIGQTLAAHHPDRVRTLTTTSASPSMRWRFIRPKLSTLPKILLLGKPGKDQQSIGDFAVKLAKVIGSTAYPVDEQWVRRTATTYPPDSAAPMRHMAVSRASGDRRADLATITAPTLVMHGDADPLLPVHVAQETARLIPGARLVIYPGMGHDMPRELWPSMISEIWQLVAPSTSPQGAA